jgi:ribosome recycling factor
MNDVIEIQNQTKVAMEKAISHLETELQKVRAGKANPVISNTASVNTQDARTLIIQPWEKSMLTPIEKAIQMANLGLNPQNDGVIIRISIPPLTEERRKELTKTARALGEDAKVGIRNARKEGMEAVKKLQKNGLPEDVAKDQEQQIQQLTDTFVGKVDKHVEQKEKEILTV